MKTFPFDPPEDLGIASPFWDAIRSGQLRLPRCTGCGRWQWYPEPAGTDCTGGELRWVPVACTGTLYSFTRVHRSFLPGAVTTPYLVGLIDLDGVDGPRLVAPLADDGDPRVGARVVARFETLDGGRRRPVFVIDA